MLARNAIEYLVLQVAASRAGVVLVPLNPRSTATEWDHVVRDAGATLLVCGPAFDGSILPAMPVTGLDELCAAGQATAPDHPGTTELLRLYTGGTTGRPRGASLSQRAVTSAMTQIAAGPHGGRPGPGERALVVAPLSHAGAVWSALAPLAWGAGLVIAETTEPADLVRVLDELRHRLRRTGSGGARADGRRPGRRGPRLPGPAPAAHRVGPGESADPAPRDRGVPLRGGAGLRADRDGRGGVHDDPGRHRARALHPPGPARLGGPGRCAAPGSGSSTRASANHGAGRDGTARSSSAARS